MLPNFEVLEMPKAYTQGNLPTGASPAITSFTSSATSVSPGIPITLSWQVIGAACVIVSPQVGAVRGCSVSVTPTQSTTYTLYATNAFGRTRSTVSVSVTVH